MVKPSANGMLGAKDLFKLFVIPDAFTRANLNRS